MRTQGKSWASASRIDVLAAAGSRLSRYRISLSPKTSTRPGFRYSWNPASASPVFWMYGLVMTRSMPSAPASKSRASPNASGRLPRSARTVTPGACATSAPRPPAAPAALRLPLPFHCPRLLFDLFNGAADRPGPAAGSADAVQKLLAARMQRDVGAAAAPFVRQDDLRGHGAVVQEPLEAADFSGDEPPECWSDFDVTACEFESH